MLAKIFSRRNTVLLVLALGAVALICATQTWVRATEIPQTLDAEITVSGQDVSPVTMAMALVALAAAIALTIVRTVGRWVIGVLLILVGAMLAWACGLVLADPVGSIQPAVAEYTGLAQDPGPVQVTVAGWICLIVGMGLALLGVVVLVAGRHWSLSSSRKYENATTTAQPESGTSGTLSSPQPSRTAEIDAWDELSRGQDPT
ncbi:Trp biosynthesis-associated membrane protein [Auritidibacter ignavus]|uniref:Trp biosynthesis-associated membrane protein n=1 Tax=Auritidibacter ignavus TaxID=678932 RepID=UPI0024B9CC14|nr:Trp biosynthesis-associated membrane protein [Auritidibacter ignavus]WHS28017.1 Trp biosynthesis-associated membrane protein [Auritidibacter ignavus]